MSWFRKLFGERLNDGAERRRSYRVRVRWPFLLVIPPEQAVSGTVTDLSDHGMKVLLSNTVKRGATVKVQLQHAPSEQGPVQAMEVSAVVAWCRRVPNGAGFSAGLSYAAGVLPRIMGQMAEFRDEPPVDLSQRRRTWRIQHRYPLQYRLPDGPLFSGSTRDLNSSGLRFTTDTAVAPGSTVEVFLLLKDGHDPVLLIGKVERCTADQDGGPYDVMVGIGHVVEDDRSEPRPPWREGGDPRDWPGLESLGEQDSVSPAAGAAPPPPA